MTFLPIVARELRVAARRRSTYLGRLGAAFVPIVIAGFWLPVLADQFTTSQGKLLFGVLSTLAFAYTLAAGTRTTSDCLSVEKREGTIGLLFLTDLKGYDVVLGKLASSSLTAFYGLLGIVPVLALALLLGGVTIVEVGRTALLLGGTLFFSMATGVFVSTLSRDDRRAMFATACVILLVTAGPYVLAWGSSISSVLSSSANPTWSIEWADVLKASPAFAFQTLRGNIGATGIQDFYVSILTTHLISWMFLATASLLVPRVCRERPPGRLGIRWLTIRNRWSYGRPDRRQAFRTRLLDRNAFYWLAARDRIKAYYVWFFVLALALIWAWCGWMLEGFVFDWDVSLPLLYLLFVFFKVWLVSEVCMRLVEDRSSGAFELLLSSPLDLKEMARGQSLALWRQFGRPIAAILIIGGVLLHSALLSPRNGVADPELRLLFWSMAIMLVADLLTLKWVGMWQAITRSQIHRATMAACSRILLLPTILFLVLFALMNLFQFAATGGTNRDNFTRGRACALWLAIGLGTDLFFGLRARWQFLHQFREVATQRFAPAAGLEPFLALGRGIGKWIWPKRQVRPGLTGKEVHWRRWLIATPVLAVLVALIGFSLWKHSLEWQIQAKVRAIQASGEPITLAALEASGGVLQEKDNAATYFRSAALKLTPLIRMARNLNSKSKLEWPSPGAPLAPECSQSLEQLIAANRGALDLLRVGAKVDRSRIVMNWPSGPPNMAVWQVLGPLQSAPEILQFEALLHLERGDMRRAFEVVQTLLGVARAIGQEPFLAGQHIRSACFSAAERALERILGTHSLTREQIELLMSSFHEAEISTGPSFARALIGERCLQIEQFRSPAQRAMMFGAPSGALEKALADFVDYTSSALGFRSRQFLEMLDGMNRLIARSRLIGSRDREALPAMRPAPDLSSPRPWSRFAAMSWYWDDLLTQQIEVVVGLRLAQAALAAEQFRLENHGRIPQTVEELEGMLPEIAIDPFSTGPLHYRVLEKGYVIYSVGRDGNDDGGLPPGGSSVGQARRKLDLTFQVAP